MSIKALTSAVNTCEVYFQSFWFTMYLSTLTSSYLPVLLLAWRDGSAGHEAGGRWKRRRKERRSQSAEKSLETLGDTGPFLHPSKVIGGPRQYVPAILMAASQTHTVIMKCIWGSFLAGGRKKWLVLVFIVFNQGGFNDTLAKKAWLTFYHGARDIACLGNMNV